MIQVHFTEDKNIPSTGTVVLGVFEDKTLTPAAQRLAGPALQAALSLTRFSGKKNQTTVLIHPQQSTFERIVLIGLGKKESWNAWRLEELGGSLYSALQGGIATQAHVVLDGLDVDSSVPASEGLARVASGALLKSWRFDVYRTQLKDEDKPALQDLVFAVADPAAAQKAFEPLKAVAEGVFLTRFCVSEPPNVIYPQSLAEKIQEDLEPLGVLVKVLGPQELTKIGMRALLGVAQGSVHEARVVVMEWKGRTDQAGPVALVGKGVTFDSGGISIKPSKDMDHMKYDMAGAGAVIGALKALALRKAQSHVVGIVGLVENMPDGGAQRPGDIVRSLSGQTIEILNTDAEGRLVLCDLLTYVQDHYKPIAVADIATLTGAITVALGSEQAGLFTSDDELASQLTQAGTSVGELVWRFPLMEAYDRLLDSSVADVQNISNGGPGSITAAQFLKRFVREGTKWAHLDIAGMAWAHSKDRALCQKGATGYGVRLFNQWVASFYEAKA